MKTFKLATAAMVAVSLMFALSCGEKQGTADDQNARSGGEKVSEAQFVETTISLPTMRCKMCQKTIDKAITALEGIQETRFDMDAKTVSVKYAGASVELPVIEQAIASVGYHANETKRDETAYELLEDCCK